MHQHPILDLVLATEANYKSEIAKFWVNSAKQKAKKLYQLISSAKNESQLEKELLFQKLFTKSYSEKSDYLWRNELRVLKEELEKFYIQLEHQRQTEKDNAYNDWLLIQAYNRIKYQEGIAEVHNRLQYERHNHASYFYSLEASVIYLLNLHLVEKDMQQIIGKFPIGIIEAKDNLAQLIAFVEARLNSFVAQHNFIQTSQHQNADLLLSTNQFSIELPENNISQFFNHYALSFASRFENQISHLEAALILIEPIAKHNKLYEINKLVIMISLAREYSANGFFGKAHLISLDIKPLIDKDYKQFKTVFYVNFIANLVKYEKYEDALYILDKEFSTDTKMYQYMLLQSRLICYLFLHKVEELGQYITADLDEAPFPINFLLRLIKSIFFYLKSEHETALNLVSNLLHTKDAAERMADYEPMAQLFKKLYTITLKNKGNRKCQSKDIEVIKHEIILFETTADPKIKLVAVYLWFKSEVERLEK